MRLLVDLSILRHPLCGLGQVALGYGRWYGDEASVWPPDWEVTLLVPKEFVGRFGSRVRYLVARDAYRFCPWLMPRFDVWHSIHQFSPFRPSGHGVRRVLTIHDVNFIYEKQGAKRRRYLRRLQRECDTASTLCFISRFARDDAFRHIRPGGQSVHVVPNGVPDLTAGPQERPPAVAADAPYFLSLGVVRPKKNLHTLLPMMDLLPGYRLVVAGDDSGPYARTLKEQAAAHPAVDIIGPVSDAGRRWLYAHCAALLFPSLAEGFGLPVVEAMQWGKPVVCSALTSLPEVGGQYAAWFPGFGPKEMATAVEECLATFTTGKARAEQAYAASFSQERHMRQYWEIYTSVR